MCVNVFTYKCVCFLTALGSSGTKEHTSPLQSSCPSSPLNHQIQYIIFSIGLIEFPLPLLNELVLRELAGNEGPAAPELHFCCSVSYFLQFSHCLIANCISQSALLSALTLSAFYESLLFAIKTVEQSFLHVMT